MTDPNSSQFNLAANAPSSLPTSKLTAELPHNHPQNLPPAEFAFPGPLRDQLVAAILDGSKTSTTGLVIDYQVEQEDLPQVGSRQLVLDSDGKGVAVIETTEVKIARVADVDLQHAIDEGEGFTTVAQWRAGHEDFWHSQEVRDALGDPNFQVTDDTEAVLERFKLVQKLERP